MVSYDERLKRLTEQNVYYRYDKLVAAHQCLALAEDEYDEKAWRNEVIHRTRLYCMALSRYRRLLDFF